VETIYVVLLIKILQDLKVKNPNLGTGVVAGFWSPSGTYNPVKSRTPKQLAPEFFSEMMYNSGLVQEQRYTEVT